MSSDRAAGASAHAGARPGGRGDYWLYGLHAVAAALANPARACLRLVATPEAAGRLRDIAASPAEHAASDHPPRDLVQVDRRADARITDEVADRRALDTLLPEGAVHQGVALLTRPLSQPALESFLAALPPAGSVVLVLLDQISDPHNVGAVLRSAAAFGAAGLVATDRHAPPETAALAKAASGALEIVPLIRATNLSRAIETLQAGGFWCVGLAGEAERRLDDIALPDRVAFAVGAEGSGLRRLTRERCDLLLRLPTLPAMPSLNVSNAAAVALYEAARQRGRRP